MKVEYSRHFSKNELRCKCGCDFPGMDGNFIIRLEHIRGLMGSPLYLSSAYRCPAHNQKVSHSGPKGPHTTGRAVDIKIGGIDAHRLLKFAFAAQFTGIGVNQSGSTRFIHLDDLTRANRPMVWSY